MRDSFIFFNSYYDAIRELPDEEQGQIYKAIIDYALDQIEPNGLSFIGKMCFKLIKPTIDASLSRYDANVENGKKGGRPKNPNKTEIKPKNNPIKTQSKPNKNPNETQTEPKQNLNMDMDTDMDMDIKKDMDVDICMCTNELEYIESTSNTDTRAIGGDKVAEHTPSQTNKKFVKPTVLEVQKYCEERGNQVDPQRFCDFYDSKGWRVGNTPMKDWRACVRTWEQNETKSARERTEYSQTQSGGSNVFLDVLQNL